jgi:hypothetical protein
VSRFARHRNCLLAIVKPPVPFWLDGSDHKTQIARQFGKTDALLNGKASYAMVYPFDRLIGKAIFDSFSLFAAVLMG